LIRDEFKLAPFEIKSWPHLVGRPVDEAIKEIEKEHPGKMTVPCDYKPFFRNSETKLAFLCTAFINPLLQLISYFCFRVQGGETGSSCTHEIGHEN
jgi:hypothetical protein